MLMTSFLFGPWMESGNWDRHIHENFDFICDVIKQNESDVANTVFKIQLNKATSFFCFLLFLQSFNSLYLQNQLPNYHKVFTQLNPK